MMASKLKVGLYATTQFTAETDLGNAKSELVEQVRLARASGFSSLWLPHHYLTQPMKMLATIPMLAYLAREAEGMMVGPNILVVPLLNPVHVAEDAVTLDFLTGGNYVLGMGVGYREAEFNAFNVPLKERAQRFEESIEIMRRLWTEERVTYHGKIFHIQDLGIGVKPVRKGGVPIWIGGVVDVAMKRAARMGDAWLITNFAPYADLVRQMKIYRETLAEVGKTFPVDAPITRECYIGSSRAAALDECRRRAPVQIRRLFVLGARQAVEGVLVIRPALRGVRQGQVHHWRQGAGEGRNPALPRDAGRQSLHHACAMARPRAGQGDAHDRRAR